MPTLKQVQEAMVIRFGILLGLLIGLLLGGIFPWYVGAFFFLAVILYLGILSYLELQWVGNILRLVKDDKKSV